MANFLPDMNPAFGVNQSPAERRVQGAGPVQGLQPPVRGKGDPMPFLPSGQLPRYQGQEPQGPLTMERPMPTPPTPEITEEQVDAAVDIVSDKDGNFSWGDLFMAVGRGVGGIAKAMGPAGVGALAGAAMGGGLQGAAYGAAGAMGGKYQGLSEGMELRQKYALARQKMGTALNDKRVANLKFLYDQQIKGHQYEKAARTMTQISTLTGVNLAEDENTAMHMAMKVEYRKKNFESDFDTAMAGIYGADATPDQQALTAYVKRFTEDESNIRAMLGIPDDKPVTQAHRDSALRALGSHVEGFQQGASESFIKALHSQNMTIARTQNQFLGSFWAKVGEGQNWRGEGQQSFESGLAALTQAQNQGHSPGYVNVRSGLDSLGPGKKMKLIKDNISDLYNTKNIDNYVALMNQSGHEMTTSQAAIGLVSGVLDAGQLEEVRKHIGELERTMGIQVRAVAPGVTQGPPVAPPGQQGPLPTPTQPPGATPTPPGATMGPGQQGPLPAPAPTPAGLREATQTIQRENLGNAVINTIIDNPDLANATSPEDMLDQAARINPTIRQAISDTGVKQVLANEMFKDTSKYKRFVTEGTPERDLAQLQRDKEPSSIFDSSRHVGRSYMIEKGRERLAESEAKEKRLSSSAEELLAHYRSGSEKPYKERLEDEQGFMPPVFGEDKRGAFATDFAPTKAKGPMDEILKKQPEYKEILQAGVPEKEALDVFKDALWWGRDWKDDERVREAVLEGDPSLREMRDEDRYFAPEGATQSAQIRQRLNMLTRGGGSPSSPGAGDTTEPPAPVTTSPSQISQQNKPQRRRNPGNIQAGGVADQWAQRDSDGNLILDEEGHLQFETAEDGFKAMEADITAKISGNSPATQTKLKKPNVEDVDELGKVYAEDPNWANNVKSILKRDHDIDADSIHIRQIPIPALVDSISKAEGFLA